MELGLHVILDDFFSYQQQCEVPDYHREKSRIDQ